MSKTTETDIENVTLEWLAGMGYTILPGPSISPGGDTLTPGPSPKERGGMAEREDYGQVVLTGRLREALVNINPDLPESAIEEAVRAVCRIESPSLIENNRRFHRMLTDGVDVSYRKDGSEVHGKVWLVDLDNPDNNDFLAVNQFTTAH